MGDNRNILRTTALMLFFSTVLLKMHFLDQQHYHHLENLLEMRMVGPHLRLTESETMGDGTQQSVV